MIAVAVCDDDQKDLKASAQIIEEFVSECGLDIQVAEFTDLTACIAAASKFDIVFMDIEFEGGPLGIDATGSINKVAPDCQVVYLTNYLHYALDVYQTSHVWYVLKKQLPERLPEIFQKIALIKNARQASIVITTKDGGNVVSVPCASIEYLERRERITRIVTTSGEYVVRDKLADVLDRLPESTFARCHNSYAVNLVRVREIHAADLLLDNGTKVLVSRSYSKRFRERYLLWAESWTV